MSDSIPQNVPQKQCTLCKAFKPATREYFHWNKCNPDGFQYQCIQCRKEKRRPAPLFLDGKMRCSQCGVYKSPTPEYFYVCSCTATGFYSKCRECRKSPNSTEKRKQSARRYREMHAESIKERYRPEYMRAMNRRSYYAHIEARKNYRRTHRQERNALERKRRACKEAVSGTHTPEQIQEQLKRQKYKCYYARCGFAKFPRKKVNGTWEYDYEVEHTFPISRVAGTDIPANSIDYLVLSCSSCNESKRNKFPWEWPEGGRLL